MMGHLALPWLDPGTDYLGPRPATLSRKIQTELLALHRALSRAFNLFRIILLLDFIGF